VSNPEVILGIDPGTIRCGLGVVARRGSRYVHLGHRVARAPNGAPLAERLASIADEIDAVILEFRPGAVALEQAFFHRDPHAAMVLGHARGVAMLLAARNGLPVGEYPPATVKRAVVGTGKADKDQVSRMIQAILGLDAPPPHDAADALAIAICHAQTRPLATMVATVRVRR
jgi:crossover junction endodeoxyribonuclease RuvC